MIQDVHSAKISKKVVAPVGTTAVIAAQTDGWIYIHELMGDLSAAGTVEILSGSTSLGKFALADGQGLTLQDEPGNDGVPRFMCKPGEAFNLITTGGSFDGTVDYSIRY